MSLPVASSDSGGGSSSNRPSTRRLSPASSKNKLNFAAVVKGEQQPAAALQEQVPAVPSSATVLHLSKLSLAVYNTDHNPTMQNFLRRLPLQPSNSTEDDENIPMASIGSHNPDASPHSTAIPPRSSALPSNGTIMDQGSYRPLDASEDADDKFHARLEEEMRTKLKMPRTVRLERQRSRSRDANVRNKLQEKIQRNNKLAVEELKKGRAAARKRFVSSAHQSGGDVEAVPTAPRQQPQQRPPTSSRGSRGGGKASVHSFHNDSDGAAVPRNNSASFGNRTQGGALGSGIFSNAADDEFNQISNVDDQRGNSKNVQHQQQQRLGTSPNATWLSSSSASTSAATNSSGSSGATIKAANNTSLSSDNNNNNRNRLVNTATCVDDDDDAQVPVPPAGKSRHRQKNSLDREKPLANVVISQQRQQQSFRQQRSLNTDSTARYRQSGSASQFTEPQQQPSNTVINRMSSYEHQRSQRSRRRDLFRKHDRELKLLNVESIPSAESTTAQRSQQIYMGPGLRCIPHERMDIAGTNAAAAALPPIAVRRSPGLGVAGMSHSSVDLTQYQKQQYTEPTASTAAELHAPETVPVNNAASDNVQQHTASMPSGFLSLRRGKRSGTGGKPPFRNQDFPRKTAVGTNVPSVAAGLKHKSSAAVLFPASNRHDLLSTSTGSRNGSGTRGANAPKDERDEFARTLSTLIHVRCSRNRDNANDIDAAAAAAAAAAADTAYPFGAAQYARRDSRDSGHGSSIARGKSGETAYRCNVQDVLWLELRSWRHDLKLLEQEQLILEGRREAQAIYAQILSMQTILIDNTTSECAPCREVEAWQTAADSMHTPSPHSLDIINTNYISCLAQTFARVHELLLLVGKAEELYPHTRYLEADIPTAAKPELQGRLQTLYMWYNTYCELSMQLDAIADIVAGSSRRRSEVFPKLSRVLPRNPTPSTASLPLSGSNSSEIVRPTMAHSNSTVTDDKESDASGPTLSGNQSRAELLRSSSSVVASSGIGSHQSSPSATPTGFGGGGVAPIIDPKYLQQFTPPGGVSRQQTTTESSPDNNHGMPIVTPTRSIVTTATSGGTCITIGNGEAMAMCALSLLKKPGDAPGSGTGGSSSGGTVSPAAGSSMRGGHHGMMLRVQSTPNDSTVRKKSIVTEAATPPVVMPTADSSANAAPSASDAKISNAAAEAGSESARPVGPAETAMSVVRHYLLRNLRRGLPEIVNSFDRRLNKLLSKRLDELRSVAPNGSSYRTNMKRLKLPSLEPILLYLIRLPLLVLQEAMLIRRNQKPSSLLDFTSILQLKSECNEILSIASVARRQYIDLASRLAFNSKHIIEATLDEFDEQFHEMIMLYIEYLSEAVTCVTASQTGHSTPGAVINKDMLESEWRFVWQKLDTMQESNYVLPKAFCETTSQIFLAISDYLSQGMEEFFADLKKACDQQRVHPRPRQQKLLSSQSEMTVSSPKTDAEKSKPVSKKPIDSKAIDEDTEDEDETDEDDDDDEETEDDEDGTEGGDDETTDNDADDESDLDRASVASVDGSDNVDDIDDEEEVEEDVTRPGTLLADADERRERLRKRDAYRLFMRRCKLLYNQAAERAQDALKFAKVLRKDLEICSIYERNVSLDKFLEGLEGTGHHRVTFSYSAVDWQQQNGLKQFSRGLSTFSGASGGIMQSNSKSFSSPNEMQRNSSPASDILSMTTPSATLENCMFFVPDTIADDSDLIRQLLSSPVGAQVFDSYDQGYLLVVPIDEAYHSFRLSANRMQQQQKQLSLVREHSISGGTPTPTPTSHTTTFARQSSLLRPSSSGTSSSAGDGKTNRVSPPKKTVEFSLHDDDNDIDDDDEEDNTDENDNEQTLQSEQNSKSFSQSTSMTSSNAEMGLSSVSDNDNNNGDDFEVAVANADGRVKNASSAAKSLRVSGPTVGSDALSLKLPQRRSLSEVDDLAHWTSHQPANTDYSRTATKPPYHRTASMLLEWKGPTIVIESGSGDHGFAMTRFPMHVHERELQFIVLRNNDLFLKRKDFEHVVMRALHDAVPSAEPPIVCRRLQSPCHSHIFNVLQQLKTKAIDAGAAMLAGISRIEQQHAIIAYALDAAFIDTSLGMSNDDSMPSNLSNNNLTAGAAANVAFNRTISLFSSSSSMSGNLITMTGNVHSGNNMLDRVDSANTLSSSIGSMGNADAANGFAAAARRGSLQTTIGGGGTSWAVTPTSSASNSSTLQSAHRQLVIYLYDRLMEYARELVRLFTKGESREVSMFLLTALRAWMSFVMQRTERGRQGVRPRWAHVGFEFIALAVQAVHTRHLEDDEFSQFKDAVRRCIDHVIGESSEEIESMRAAVGAAMGVFTPMPAISNGEPSVSTSAEPPPSASEQIEPNSRRSSIERPPAVTDGGEISTMPPKTLTWPTHFRSNHTAHSTTESSSAQADGVLPVGADLPPGLTPNSAASMHTVSLLQPQHNSGGGLTIISQPSTTLTSTTVTPASGGEVAAAGGMKRYWSNVNDYNTTNRFAGCTSGGFVCNLNMLAEEEVAAVHMEENSAAGSASPPPSLMPSLPTVGGGEFKPISYAAFDASGLILPVYAGVAGAAAAHAAPTNSHATGSNSIVQRIPEPNSGHTAAPVDNNNSNNAATGVKMDSNIATVTFAHNLINNHNNSITASNASSGVSVMPPAHRFRHACEQLDRDRTSKLLKTKLIGRIVPGKPDTAKHLRSRRVNFRWQRGDLVGQGRYGKVYQAVNLDEGRTIAVKCFSESAGPQAKQFIELMQEIDREMVVLEGLDHENIVKYYGVEVHRDEVCIFMEYCNSGDLAQASQQGLSLPVIRNYTAQILRGIEYLHDHKIIHLDMKGENILLTNDGEFIKIADFNTAVKLRSSMTMTADVPDLPVGTPAFMAPEMINRTSTPGRSADIWSIGCCVVQMLSGKPPFSEMNNSFQVMFAIGQGRSPKFDAETASKDGSEFLTACFAAEPHQRPMASGLLHYKFVAGV